MTEQSKHENLSALKQRLACVAALVWILVAIVMVQQAVAGAEKPFNTEDLAGWSFKHHDSNESQWRVGTAKLHPDDPRALLVTDGDELVNANGHGVDIYSDEVYGDHVIELEVMVPRGSNSGIYVHGEYEVQVLDSYGQENPGVGDMGGIYGAAPPKNPRYVATGEWNTFRIAFRAPRFNSDGEKTHDAVFEEVKLNGRVIHEDLTIGGPTPAGVDGREKAEGPIMFQGDHGPVSYRNIRITPLD